MQIWRITKEEYVKAAFSGIGAEKVAGRWNHPGYKIVYTSATLSLASLETFVHVEPNIIPDDLHGVTATLPDNVTIEDYPIANLPVDWQAYPGPTSLKDFGTQWLQEKRSLILRVPSAINPVEKNLLINPLHPEISTISNIVSQPFKFDPRMWK
jgi:RES domain-containing protein